VRQAKKVKRNRTYIVEAFASLNFQLVFNGTLAIPDASDTKWIVGPVLNLGAQRIAL
jgi:hypothetical protein